MGFKRGHGTVYFRDLQPEPRAKGADAVDTHLCRGADAISARPAVAVNRPQKRHAGGDGLVASNKSKN